MDISYTERIVAFIDVLGFKDIVDESEKNIEKLQLIFETLTSLKKWEVPDKWGIELIEIEESAQKKGVDNFQIENDVQCTCFSDSIVVSVSICNQAANEVLATLITNLALIGAKLITEGILIRGGITVGNLIHTKDGTIIGKAFIDAYQLENSAAIYPRIILSNKMIEQLNYPIYHKNKSYPYHQYLSRYEDGCVGFSQLRYFQVLQSWESFSNEQLKTELGKARKTIINGLNRSVEHPQIYKKYRWLRDEYEKLVILQDGLKENIKPINENTIHYPG